ncbi:MAG: aryl-sulfate sulfotransferase [Bacteroidia bacterium]|nr:aryl-sulfate sulfotransferase [Bacteroidia bacterium]
MRNLTLVAILLFVFGIDFRGQSQNTVGLIQNDPGSFQDGYFIFSPVASHKTYLVDHCGSVGKSWDIPNNPGLSGYLGQDGFLYVTGSLTNTNFVAGGRGGVIHKQDWNGNVLWSYTISDSLQCQHHDILPLENGNILLFAWDLKTKPQAMARGRNPSQCAQTLFSEKIMEIQPVGTNEANIVWEWKLWDHLIQDFDNTKPNFGVVADNPHLVDINFKAFASNSDWIHLNSIDYNPVLNQIMVSVHAFNEIWIIDKSTTTEEAAGHVGGNSGKGGDLLYRWGNPASYGHGTSSVFYGQHNAHWIKPGLPFENQIMVFNNGLGHPGTPFSTVEIINPPVLGYNYDQTLPYLPANQSWVYNRNNEKNWYSINVGSAQMLPNGHVFVTDGAAGRFFEIDTLGNQYWAYVNPDAKIGILEQDSTPTLNQLFSSILYPSDFPGFAGHALVSQGIIENRNSLSDTCILYNGINSPIIDATPFIVYPNPGNGYYQIDFKSRSEASVEVYDLQGKKVAQLEKAYGQLALPLTLNSSSPGCYMVKIQMGEKLYHQRVILE